MKRRISGNDVQVALAYNAAVREWIHDMKFARTLSSRDHSALLKLAERFFKENEELDFDSIVAVPSHPVRSLLQVDLSWEWARCVSEVCQKPIRLRMLSHASLTQAILRSPQKFRSPEQRRRLFFEEPRRFVSVTSDIPRRILLVDDVINTGCTLFAARNALGQAGHEVRAQLVLASPL